jgi:hippurate hydrolase
MPLPALPLALVLAAASPAGPRAAAAALAPLDALWPELDALYQDLHRTPELSGQEERTAAKMAARLRAIGFEVTERVGGHGVVGVLRNGEGPTLLVRTDLDGLPVQERTGLPYASAATATGPDGRTVPVMHACGHDVHMSGWIGAATLLSRAREAWRGTLVFVGQPAEETGRGAAAMLADGLFQRFGKPDFAIAVHDAADMAAGDVGFVPGWALANVDSVDVTFFGRGGHGAYPHRTVDPIVMAARFVVAVQTVVSREQDPTVPAVVTVGSFHAGTKHNVIPDEATLQLTVRTYEDDVRTRVLAAIARVAKGEAAAAGAPRQPEVKVREDDTTRSTYNDPALTRRLAGALAAALGPSRVEERKPVMGGEDFSAYGRAGVPASILWIGAQDPKALAAARAAGKDLPSLHSSEFAPDRERAVKTGAATLTIAALELLGRR